VAVSHGATARGEVLIPDAALSHRRVVLTTGA
jgi:hypothetical protein